MELIANYTANGNRDDAQGSGQMAYGIEAIERRLKLRVPKSAVGRVVIFHGYDGNDYTAHVEQVTRRGQFVKLLYRVKEEWVTAILDNEKFNARCA